MSDPVVIAKQKGHVLTLTLNRPNRRNAFDATLAAALAVELERAEADSGVRVIILTGAGDVFCAGGDIAGLRASLDDLPSAEVEYGRLGRAADPVRLLRGMPKPTISRVRGAVAGGGLALAASCDLRIGDETAKFAFGYPGIGLSGDLGVSSILVERLGASRALDFCLQNRTLKADEAEKLGLLSEIAPSSSLTDRCQAIALKLAQTPPFALRAIKANIDAASRMSFEDALEVEARNFIACRRTEDHREACDAFLEKRPAHFIGR